MYLFVIDIQFDHIDIELFKNIRRGSPSPAQPCPLTLPSLFEYHRTLHSKTIELKNSFFFRVVEHLIKKSLCGTTRYFVKAHVLLQLSGMIWSVIFSAKRCQFIQRLYNNYNPILHIYRVFRKNCGFFFTWIFKILWPFPRQRWAAVGRSAKWPANRSDCPQRILIFISPKYTEICVWYLHSTDLQTWQSKCTVYCLSYCLAAMYWRGRGYKTTENLWKTHPVCMCGLHICIITMKAI